MDTNALKEAIFEILHIDGHTQLADEFNIFLYDSFTKVNLILALETFSDNENISIDELVQCDTYEELIELAVKMHEEVTVTYADV